MDELSAFMHTPSWERFQKAAGFRVARDGDNLCILHPLAKQGSYWSSARCLISESWTVPDFAKKSWFIRLEPVDQQSYHNLTHLAKRKRLPLVTTLTVQPRQTAVLDLSLSEADLMQNMKQKHRYNIRVAERHQVAVEMYTENLLDHYPRFWKLLSDTAARQQFRTHADHYYRTMLSELEKDGSARLFFATKDGVDLASLMVVTCGTTATYLHGASGIEHREAMAPHGLHWFAITTLKKEGFRWYDFWGINAQQNAEGEWEPLPNHHSSGTTRFKLGFGGEVIEYPGAYDLVLNRFCYTLYQGVRRLRGRKRSFS